MAAIRLHNVSKAYGQQVVVRSVTVTIAEGELLAFLGPSGCGKTSTLRMIAGLEEATTGEVWFDDRLMNNVAPGRRNVGMVFQNYALYPHMTVYDNLAIGLRWRGAGRAAARRQVEEIAELLDIGGLLARRPKELSGGERQRVALGRALIKQPAVSLMDEPLSNLDAVLRERMRMELARLHQQLPVTTVYVTHDQAEALTLADRVAVMHAGQVRQVGTPLEIYDRPADSFVAGFVGSPGMNLFTHAWTVDGDSIFLQGGLRLPRALLDAMASSGPTVTVGLRPEHLAPAAGDGPVELRCHVETVEHLGSHQHVHARLGGPTGPPLIARVDARMAVSRGPGLVLTAPSEAVHLFDPATTGRIEPPPAARPTPAMPGLGPAAVAPRPHPASLARPHGRSA